MEAKENSGDEELIQRYISYYANALADVAFSKNLEKHFVDIINIIGEHNERIDELLLMGNTSFANTLKIMIYDFYRLKESIVIAIGDRKIKI